MAEAALVTQQRGLFITLEGTEGVGKSTNLEFIRTYIEANNIPLVVTREPGGTPLAEEIRELLLAKRDEKVDDLAELLMVFAARAQHFHRVIEPALAAGKWVLSDRFTDATYAYQGGGRGIDLNTITTLETLVQGERRPDLTIILDVDVEVGLTRAGNRAELDRFESEAVAFFERVRAAYLERAAQAPNRYAIVDAGKTLDEVQQQLVSVLQTLLPG